MNPNDAVIFNGHKHHAGFLKARIRQVAIAKITLQDFAEELIVIGTELMDFYLGAMTITEIVTEVTGHLQAEDRLNEDSFRAWIATTGWKLIPTSDGTEWILRHAVQGKGQYIHLHPGRHVKNTIRMRANVLKTALMSVAYSTVFRVKADDLSVINHVRRRFLHLEDINGNQDPHNLFDTIKLLKG